MMLQLWLMWRKLQMLSVDKLIFLEEHNYSLKKSFPHSNQLQLLDQINNQDINDALLTFIILVLNYLGILMKRNSSLGEKTAR